MSTIPRRPNVLVVMSDEQSWNTLGANGNAAAHTPHLDALAAEATSFDRCYTPFPLCCPSRASLWTGRMPRHHGVLGNWRPIVPDLRDTGVAQAFRKDGYHTIYSGKWHVPGTTPERMGWVDRSAIPAVLGGQDRGRYIPDYRDYAAARGYRLDPRHIENLTAEDIAHTTGPGAVPYATASISDDDFLETWQTGEFLRALDRRPGDSPWLAACSFNAPHFPMVVPAPYDRIIDRSRVRLPDSLAAGAGTRPREVRESHYATDFVHLTTEQWTEVTAHYLGLCALVDTQFGRIVEYLRAAGEWDNTIVVFTTDHGDMMGAHGLMEKGHLLHYEEALRVPLLIRHPGRPAARNTNLTSVCDIARTLATLAGVPWDEPDDGRCFAHAVGATGAAPTREYVSAETTLADGQAGGHGDPFYAEHWSYPRDSLNASIRTARARYVFRSHDEDELFDLTTDPSEVTNLADRPDRQAERQLLRDLLAGELADAFPSMAERLRHPAGHAG